MRSVFRLRYPLFGPMYRWLPATALAAFVLLFPALFPDSRPAHALVRPRPNVVMIMTDDQTVELMRYLPHTQQLIARQGVTFANSYVSYSLCCPSRTTYFTGQYAHNHRVRFNHPPLGGFPEFKDQQTTFQVALHRAGYFTEHIGKYLNDFHINPRRIHIPPGWSRFYGLYDPYTYRYYGFNLVRRRGIDSYPAAGHQYQTDVLARLAVAAIRQRSHSTRPFFLNVALVAPHVALGPQAPPGTDIESVGMGGDNGFPVPPARYRGKAARIPLPRGPAFDQPDVSQAPAYIRALPRFSAADVQRITERYRDRIEAIWAVDDAVQHIMDALRQTHLLGKTYVFFTSDNGFFSGEHRIPTGKYYAYEPSQRVPLLVRGPGLPRGVVREQLVANIDLAPTILDLAHVRPLRPPDGASLLPLIRHPRQRWGRDLLFESFKNSAYPVAWRGIRTYRYVYLMYNTGETELYDLTNDPDELHNLEGDPALRGVQTTLDRRLQRLAACAGASCRAGPRLRLSIHAARGAAGCIRSALQVAIGGPDQSQISRVDVLVDQAPRASVTGAPFAVTLPSAAIRRHPGSSVLVSVETVDGREQTYAQRLTRCS